MFSRQHPSESAWESKALRDWQSEGELAQRIKAECHWKRWDNEKEEEEEEEEEGEGKILVFQVVEGKPKISAWIHASMGPAAL